MPRVAKPPYFPFTGGLNLVTPALSKDSGEVIFSKGYEPNIRGGYRQVSGYERFDGQTRPVDTTKVIDSVTETTDSYHFLSDANKTLFDTDRETNRTAILTVPGEGDILGVTVYNDVVYAIRNAVGGATAVMFKSTASGWSSVKTGLLPDGRYEFDVYNFGSGKMLYGCDGVNPAFQWDGTTFTQITTGQSPDTPEHIQAHKGHLFLSFPNNGLVNSETGDPLAYTAGGGAVSYNITDDVTGVVHIKDILAIFCETRTLLLYGTSSLDFSLVPHSDTAGAYAYSIITEASPVFLSKKGISVLSSIDAYGNFEANSLSSKIKPWLDDYQDSTLVAGAAIDVEKNMYRLYFTDGKCVYMLFDGQQGGDILTHDYEINFTCIGQGTVSGEQYILAGCDDGYVYQMEIGGSLDGSDIESIVKPTYAHFGSPQRRKRFFNFVLELDAPTGADIYYTPDFSYGDPNTPAAITQNEDVESGGGLWNVMNWGEFFWSSPIVAQGRGAIKGSGTNISTTFYTVTKNNKPYTLQGLTYNLSLRGQVR